MRTRSNLFTGPVLVFWSTAIVALWSLVLLWHGAFTEESVIAVLTLTIRAAFLFFALTFATSSIRYFFRSRFTLWLLKNRRYIGLSFASAFVLHFLAIGLRAWLFPDPFADGLHQARVIRGGALLGTVLLLAATSSDFVVANVRQKLWRLTHLCGSYYIFYRFWENYWSFSQHEEIYYVGVGILCVAAGFRVSRFWVLRLKRWRSLRGNPTH